MTIAKPMPSFLRSLPSRVARGEDGFTLIELAIAFTLFAALLGLLIWRGFVDTSEQRSVTGKNLVALVRAEERFYAAHGRYSTAPQVDLSLPSGWEASYTVEVSSGDPAHAVLTARTGHDGLFSSLYTARRALTLHAGTRTKVDGLARAEEQWRAYWRDSQPRAPTPGGARASRGLGALQLAEERYYQRHHAFTADLAVLASLPAGVPYRVEVPASATYLARLTVVEDGQTQARTITARAALGSPADAFHAVTRGCHPAAPCP